MQETDAEAAVDKEREKELISRIVDEAIKEKNLKIEILKGEEYE